MERKRCVFLMTLKEKLTACMEDAVARQEVAGASVLVMRHGGEVVYAAAGMADREAGRPMARDTICRLFSQSKPVTAVAVMLLAERGQLDLCEPVETFLPGFRKQQVLTEKGLVPARRQATVMDLLGMTAGLCYPGEDPAGKAAAELFAENDARVQRGEGCATAWAGCLWPSIPVNTSGTAPAPTCWARWWRWLRAGPSPASWKRRYSVPWA